MKIERMTVANNLMMRKNFFVALTTNCPSSQLGKVVFFYSQLLAEDASLSNPGVIPVGELIAPEFMNVSNAFWSCRQSRDSCVVVPYGKACPNLPEEEL